VFEIWNFSEAWRLALGVWHDGMKTSENRTTIQEEYPRLPNEAESPLPNAGAMV